MKSKHIDSKFKIGLFKALKCFFFFHKVNSCEWTEWGCHDLQPRNDVFFGQCGSQIYNPLRIATLPANTGGELDWLGVCWTLYPSEAVWINNGHLANNIKGALMGLGFNQQIWDYIQKYWVVLPAAISVINTQLYNFKFTIDTLKQGPTQIFNRIIIMV